MKTFNETQRKELVETEIRRILKGEMQFDWNLARSDISAWNSLEHIKLMVSLEKVFEVRFDTDEVVSIKLAQDVLNLVERKLGNS